MLDSPGLSLIPAKLGKRAQLGLVVTDMERTLRYWTEVLNVGPFVLFDTSVGDRQFIHRGQPSPVEFAIAFSYVGELQIEVIQPINDAPSAYQEFLSSGRQGLHHIAFWPEDFTGACNELERSGFKEVCSINLKDGTKNVCYYDTPPEIGIMVELVPVTPDRARYFGAIKALADRWDGSRPVRRYADRAEFLASNTHEP
jgi:catechol 2,3-dioxygenase-like lactoylglutathione lyase family enzyme